jgi:hypothetical protein
MNARQRRKEDRKNLKQLSSGKYSIEVNGERFTFDAPPARSVREFQAKMTADIAEQVNTSGQPVIAVAKGSVITLTSAPVPTFTISVPPPRRRRYNRRNKA